MSEKPEFVYRVMVNGVVTKKFVSKISAVQTVSYARHSRRVWNRHTRRYDAAPCDDRIRVLRAPVGEWQDISEEFGLRSPDTPVIQEGSS